MRKESSSPPHVLGDPTFDGLARYIQRNNVRKILVMAGAGISVAAGIPDFRSPSVGIYSKLDKYELDSPTDAFSLPLLRERPHVFYSIAREMDLWPGNFFPTPVHYFIKLLADEGRLLRCCTQNIDGLERACGIPEDLLVEAHGSFSTASCIECGAPFDTDRACRETRDGKIPHCEECDGVVKPDVVFFGESLPDSFFQAFVEDTREAELLLIVGTSLQVHPFAALALRVRPNVPRVLFNLDRVGGRMFRFPSDWSRLASPTADAEQRGTQSQSSSAGSSSSDGFGQYGHTTHSEEFCRDVFFPGDCQVAVRRLADAMGLRQQLEKYIDVADKKLDK